MNEHVAPTVVGFNEAVASFAVKEFHHARLRHRDPPFPHLLRRRPHARRLGRTFTIGESVSRRSASVTPPAPTGGGTSLPMWELHTNCGAVERGHGAAVARGLPASQSSRKPPFPSVPRIALRAGNRAESSFSSVQGGL